MSSAAVAPLDNIWSGLFLGFTNLYDNFVVYNLICPVDLIPGF